MRRRDLMGALGFGALGLVARRALAATDRQLIVYWNAGGWDPSFVYDPHFGGRLEGDPLAEASTIAGIPVADADSRPSVRSCLERWGSRMCVVNGISVGSISHTNCTRILLTGERSLGAADLPTRLAAATGSELAAPHLIVSGPRFPGRLGYATVPLSETLTGTALGELPEERARVAEVEAAIQAFAQSEANRLQVGSAEEWMGLYAGALDKAERLRDSADGLRLEEGGEPYEAQVGAALSALEDGLSRCIILLGDTPLLTQWDSHVDNDSNQSRAFEHAFGRLDELLEALSARRSPSGGTLLDSAMVLFLSEMGRTPLHNGSLGKDHWPTTSALLIGAGVLGGQAVGATDDVLTALPVELSTGEADTGGEVLTPAHLLAGVLTAFDVDPETEFPGVSPFLAPFEG